MNTTQLADLCQERLTNLPKEFQDRFDLEMKEVIAQNEQPYFLDLYERKIKADNQNNLILPYLLGICDSFDIAQPPTYVYGEYPDIDVDYLPEIRDYLKEEYARQQFGDEYVCDIATYTTFGLRSALIDMAKVFGQDRKDILALTTKLGIKDDEGEPLSWDKARELYPDLDKYLKARPEMAEAAKKLLHRNRNLGKHASGLIISGVPIADFVPLVKLPGSDQALSAWVEGLHGTDLGAVGLVKFDFLSLEANMKIALACKLVGKHISALPERGSWSDIAYLNDPEALAMANQGDLKAIFQFDGSEGIRSLAKQGGVDSFDDLVAYTSLFRPSCIAAGMHEQYCLRKQGKEKYEIHPLFEDFMKTTYGVMVFQEQIMRMLNVAGKIPLKDCEIVRKAISKKKVEDIKIYREMFVNNAREVLGLEKAEDTFKQIEYFSGYGFNAGHATAYTYISSRMLYLKRHHPLEFYCAILSCTKLAGPKDYQKMKDYIRDAGKHNIEVEYVDINKSGANFRIVDGKIYYGLSKIRGIGEEVAKRIESLQPYQDYEDFLLRFGTDAKANQAVLALKLFPGDPQELYVHYESYKATLKKREDRRKRLEKTKQKYLDSAGSQEEILGKIAKAVANYLSKVDTVQEFQTDPEMLKLLTSQESAETEYLGYLWHHPLEKCPHQEGYTTEYFVARNNEIGPIELFVRNVEEKKGKKVTYYSLVGEDMNGDTVYVTVWKDDYEKLREKLSKGNCIRLSVRAPTDGFRNYTIADGRFLHGPDTRVLILEQKDK